MALFTGILLLVQAAMSLYLTGVIWLVQIVHYPLFADVGGSGFVTYEQRHRRLMTWIVALPMLLEAATTGLLIVCRPPDVSMAAVWSGVALLAVIWYSTIRIQVPCHTVLACGFDVRVHRRLVLSNWLRTVAWSLRGLLSLWMIAGRVLSGAEAG